MLNPQRIKEAEQNVKIYLKENLLKKENFQENIFAILHRNAQDSLEISAFLLQNNKSDLWIIITAYYSMFYIANATLYKIGFKVGEKIAHKVTADALIVFIRAKLKTSLLENYENTKDIALAGMKADIIIQNFDSERNKRNRVQYETKEAELHSKARTSIERAKEFLFELEKLIGRK